MTPCGPGFKKWTWLRRVTALMFLVLLALGARSWFPWFRGSTAGTSLFEVIPFADPLAAIEVTLASRDFHGAMLLGAAILIGVCLLLGPVFCGWVCPLGLLLDLNDDLRRHLARLFGRKARRKPERRLPGALRYGVLGIVLGFALVSGLPAFQALSPINLVAWSLAFFPEPAFGSEGGFGLRIMVGLRAVWAAGGVMLVVLAVIVALEYVFPRFWCRALCPLGALYSAIGRFAPLRIRINPAEAGKSRCELCAHHCPMGIEVMREYTLAGESSIQAPECTRCGECIDSCPRGVLALRFRDFPGAPHDDADSEASSSHAPELHNPLSVTFSPDQR